MRKTVIVAGVVAGLTTAFGASAQEAGAQGQGQANVGMSLPGATPAAAAPGASDHDLVVGRLARAHPLIVDVLVALLGAGGRVLSADRMAAMLGLGSRHRLARQLAHAGGPPFDELTGWTQVLIWTWAWECGGLTLPQSALAVLREPSACYRTVRRVTGKDWSVIRTLGAAWVTDQLVARLGPGADGVAQHAGGEGLVRSRAVIRARIAPRRRHSRTS